MTWEIRSTGWPIPLPETWPIPSKKSSSPENVYIMKHRDELYILPYGYTKFLTEYYKGNTIDAWV